MLAAPPTSVAVPTAPRTLNASVTVPVGTPAPGDAGSTVMVKVTGWPATDGFAWEMTIEVVDAGFTVWASAPEVLALKLASPPYTAVIGCVPVGKVVVNVAVL